MRFADKIMLLRSKKNISQKELAKALNVSRQSVYKWEADLSIPEIDKIKKMAEIFGVSCEDLLNDNISLNISENENNDIVEESATKKSKKPYPLIFVAMALFVVASIASTFLIMKLTDNSTDTPHTQHSLIRTSVINEPTCENRGLVNIKCTECEYTGTSVISSKGHTYVNNICTVCSKIKGSEGIEYEYSDLYDGYYVKSIGQCTDTKIIISNKLNDKNVVAVGKEAFAYSAIQSVKIPDTVTIIEEKAFYQCTNLSKIELGQNITSIGEYAFSKCSQLNKLVIPGSVEIIKKYAFEDTSIFRVTFGKKTKLIEIGAFHNSNIQIAEFSESSLWSLKSAGGKEILEISVEAYLDKENITKLINENWGYSWERK